jgi:hypothetical protein
MASSMADSSNGLRIEWLGPVEAITFSSTSGQPPLA